MNVGDWPALVSAAGARVNGPQEVRLCTVVIQTTGACNSLRMLTPLEQSRL